MRPDVVVTDIRMPPTETDEGIRLAAHAQGVYPDTGVLVLSQYAAAELRPGAAGLGLRRPRLPAQAARSRSRRARIGRSGRVASGGSVIDPKIVEALVAAEGTLRAVAADGAHSPRARGARGDRVGKSNTSIAESLVLTKRAVEKHINSIFLEAEPVRGGGREQAGQGDARVPRRGRAQVGGVGRSFRRPVVLVALRRRSWTWSAACPTATAPGRSPRPIGGGPRPQRPFAAADAVSSSRTSRPAAAEATTMTMMQKSTEIMAKTAPITP